MKSLTKAIAIIGLSAFAQLPASAAIVPTWGYDLVSIWTAASPTGTGTGVYTDLANKRLSWGSSILANRSSLTISSDPSGTVDTYIGTGIPDSSYFGIGSSLVHHNEPITGTSLTSATLRSTLTLFASGTDGSGTGTGPDPVNLNILFTETPNAAGTCVVSSATPCRDIFVLTTPLQNQSFLWDSTTYFVNIFPTNGNLSWLTDAACATVGITSGTSGQRCTGFTTEENQDTELMFGFTVSSSPLSVPEPESLVLVSLALLGANWVRNQKR